MGVGEEDKVQQVLRDRATETGGRGGGGEDGDEGLKVVGEGRRGGLKGGGGVRFWGRVTRDMKWKAELQQSPPDRGRFGHTGVYRHII